MRRVALTVLAAALQGVPAVAQETSTPPPGAEKSTGTGMLETGAAILQGRAPLDGMNIYLDGFHVAREDAGHQMEAHHFCRQVNEDFAQCVLFDGDAGTANLVGIEYIVSEQLFDTLPEAERRYWHPHNGEILSGQLVAPGLPDAAEKALMRSKMNSYGKTWHVWNPPSPHGGPGDALPVGEPMLMWSFNRHGELEPELLRDRDARLGYDSAAIAEGRADLLPMARPQHGVDAMKELFGRSAFRPIPGVVDKLADPTRKP